MQITYLPVLDVLRELYAQPRSLARDPVSTLQE
jgi:hypothetical protein